MAAASAASSYGSLSSLPNELLEDIAERLGGDFLSLRLASRDVSLRTFTFFCRKYFSSRLVCLNFARSLEILTAVAEHESISKCVQRVLVSDASARDLILEADGLARTPSSDSTRLQRLLSEEEWLRDGQAVTILSHALGRFTNCTKFGMATRQDSTGDPGVVRAARRIFGTTNVARGRLRIRGYQDWRRGISALTTAFLASPAHPTSLECPAAVQSTSHSWWGYTQHVSSQGLGRALTEWLPAPKAYEIQLNERLSHLQHLAIGVDIWTSSAPLVGHQFGIVPGLVHKVGRVHADLPALKQLLSACVNITSLDLTLDDSLYSSATFQSREGGQVSLAAALSAVPLPKLRVLALASCGSNVLYKRSGLNTVFETYKDSLEELHLSTITLSGSVVPCLQYIRDEMHLQKLTLKRVDEHSFRLARHQRRTTFPMRCCAHLLDTTIDKDCNEALDALIEELSKGHSFRKLSWMLRSAPRPVRPGLQIPPPPVVPVPPPTHPNLPNAIPARVIEAFAGIDVPPLLPTPNLPPPTLQHPVLIPPGVGHIPPLHHAGNAAQVPHIAPVPPTLDEILAGTTRPPRSPTPPDIRPSPTPPSSPNDMFSDGDGIHFHSSSSATSVV